MLPGGTFTVADAYNCRILFVRAPPHRPPVRHLGRVHARAAALLGRRQRGHAVAGRGRPCRARSTALGSTRSSPYGKLVFAMQSAGLLPVRSAAAAGWAHPAGRLRQPGPHPDHRPSRPRALALRPLLGPRTPRPSLSGDGLAQRGHRRQRRLPRPRARDRPAHRTRSCGSTATPTIPAPRPATSTSPTAWTSSQPGRAGDPTTPLWCIPEMSCTAPTGSEPSGGCR